MSFSIEHPLKHCRVVLVETSHPGNIGATARAMKTMGLSQMILVRPKQFPCAQATARASGADDILHLAQVCNSLEQALEGCHLVFGASARSRSIPWPCIDPRECATHILQAETGTQSALVFGREHSGLTNQELEICHYLVQIPANPDYPSLNLASAVQVLSYELYYAWLIMQNNMVNDAPFHPNDNTAIQPPPALWETGRKVRLSERPVTIEAMQRFYEHLEHALIDVAFLDPAKPKHLMRRLHRLFNRVRMNQSEYNILRGVFYAMQHAVQKGRRPK